jgi:hypothetical protein
MTASLDSLKFEPISRDRLFFDQFRYGMHFRFSESGRMRQLTREHIMANCEFVNTSMFYHKTRISDQHKEAMLELCDVINSISVPFKRVVYSNHQYFYTNNPEIFDQFRNFQGVGWCAYTEAVVDRPRDVVLLAKSNYQWRTYFRDRWYNQNEVEVLSKFLLSRSQQFRTTPYWANKMRRKYMYISSGFFVDHHDQQDVLLLNIAMPNAVRKTLPIQISNK